MLNVAVFGATISYALMALSHIVLRRREPGLRAPVPHSGRRAHVLGGAWSSRCSALVATFLVDKDAAFIALGGVRRRARLLRGLQPAGIWWRAAPEEEFAALAAAEAELERD